MACAIYTLCTTIIINPVSLAIIDTLIIYLFIYRTYLPWVTNYNKYSSLVPRYNKINIKLK